LSFNNIIIIIIIIINIINTQAQVDLTVTALSRLSQLGRSKSSQVKSSQLQVVIS